MTKPNAPRSKCLVDGCEEERASRSPRCRPHQDDFVASLPCTVTGCDNPRGKSLAKCASHHKEALASRPCGYPGCEEPRGQNVSFCLPHRLEMVSARGPCTTDGCDRMRAAGQTKCRQCIRESSDSLPCIIDSCDNPRQPTLTRCRDHHREHAEALATAACAEPGCDAPRRRQSSLCALHSVERNQARGMCTSPGCDRPRYRAMTRCSLHLWASRRGMSAERLAADLAQGCAVCGSMTNLSVDHDHDCCPRGSNTSCGKCYRGILCARCNQAMGFFSDDTARMASAIDYLESWKVRKEALGGDREGAERRLATG